MGGGGRGGVRREGVAHVAEEVYNRLMNKLDEERQQVGMEGRGRGIVSGGGGVRMQRGCGRWVGVHVGKEYTQQRWREGKRGKGRAVAGKGRTRRGWGV